MRCEILVSLKGFIRDFTFLSQKRAYRNSFAYNELKIRETQHKKPKPDPENLQFGKYFTDHMLYASWSVKDGWSMPEIRPVENLQIHPGNRTFQYATSGSKAKLGYDGIIRVFRLDENIKRFNNTTTKLCLPNIEPVESLKMIKKLIQIDRDWVPSRSNTSLYIRPTMIASDHVLGVHAPSEAIFFVLLCPTGFYYHTGAKPVTLFADNRFVRSWPGGSGDTKMAANYATTPYVQKLAEKNGCQQVLWLYGPEEQLTEVGTMNFFLVLKNENNETELATAPLDGLILPGITRASVIEIVKNWRTIQVNERVLTMAEVLKAHSENRIIEAFGTGTACVISQVKAFSYKGNRIEIPVGDLTSTSSITGRIYKELTDIHNGVNDLHNWASSIDDLG